MNDTISPRLARLRAAMRAESVAACLIPSADPHLSEYLPRHWQARAYFSGFTGSAGTLVVTLDFAGMWTDSRYFEQAERQLGGTGITLMRSRIQHTPEPIAWLCGHLAAGDALAVAGDSLALMAERRLRDEVQTIGARLRTDLDVPGLAWKDRPPLPQAPVFEHPARYVDMARRAKLARLRAAMTEVRATHHLLSPLDDIAWLTNLRGGDIDYNPVFLAHLLIDAQSCTVFADPGKFSAALRTALADDDVALADYTTVTEALARLGDHDAILYDPSRMAVSVASALPDNVTHIEQTNPTTLMKAVKSPAELANIRTAMREDGIALVRGFRRIEQSVADGNAITELDVSSILLEERSARDGFRSESFPTIAGYMANGALPHYQATARDHATLKATGLLLVDSGGQYLGGTTDITRVWALGATTDEQRRDYTLVLKGMINLSAARFPAGASGPQLDALARAPLWAAGVDYGHGTGHGVGYFLNVHEGPHGISPPRPGMPLVALQPGMISSIEPGLYRPGKHGIRHENLVVVRAACENAFGAFLEFETLSLCPFDTRAIEPSLLSADERDWLNRYHAQVEGTLRPLLDDAADIAWLHARCAPLC